MTRKDRNRNKRRHSETALSYSASPTRHTSASKPTSSTEWQLGRLNGLVGVVVVGYTDPSRVGPSPTKRPACHADRVGRYDVEAVRSYRTKLQAAYGPSEPPVTLVRWGRPLFRLRIAAREDHGQFLRFVDTVDTSMHADF